MQQLHIIMAGGFYDRTRAIIDGSVRPEGLNLSYIELPIEEVFWRVLRYGEFDVAECSLAYYMISKSRESGTTASPSRFSPRAASATALCSLIAIAASSARRTSRARSWACRNTP